jgi:hypothetical protein
VCCTGRLARACWIAGNEAGHPLDGQSILREEGLGPGGGAAAVRGGDAWGVLSCQSLWLMGPGHLVRLLEEEGWDSMQVWHRSL